MIRFFINLYKQKHVIAYMAKITFFLKYSGTYIGVIWAIINPAVTIFIYWIIFSKGLKVEAPGNTPYLLYFISGMIPWMLFSDVLNQSVSGVRGNLHLIKKTNYPSEILPVVYLLSSVITHVIFLAIFCMLLLANNELLNVNILSFFYYFIFLTFFIIGLSWILSSLNVLFRDISHVMPVILNLWFWASPVIWNKEIIPEEYFWIIKYNPMVYIIDGYRSTFLSTMSIKLEFYSTLLNLLFYMLIFILGAILFEKLKSEFSDAI